MRTLFILAAIVAQLAVVGSMVWPREVALRTGTPVWIRTAPIDPRDPFRGDYVSLRYTISSVPRTSCSPGVLAAIDRSGRRRMDQRVFAVLAIGADGLATLVELTEVEPPGGIYLRGRLDGNFGDNVFVRYGLEAYFQEQGRALALERPPADLPADSRLEMEVMVGAGGLGVIRGHRWSR